MNKYKKEFEKISKEGYSKKHRGSISYMSDYIKYLEERLEQTEVELKES